MYASSLRMSLNYRDVAAGEAALTPQQRGALIAARARQRWLEGRHAEALDLLGRAMVAEPTEPLHVQNRAHALWCLGRHREALDDALTAARMAPSSPRPLLLRGKAELGLGLYRAAVESFEAALSRDTSSTEAREQLRHAKVRELISWGVSQAQAEAALLVSGGDLEAALDSAVLPRAKGTGLYGVHVMGVDDKVTVDHVLGLFNIPDVIIATMMRPERCAFVRLSSREAAERACQTAPHRLFLRCRDAPADPSRPRSARDAGGRPGRGRR